MVFIFLSYICSKCCGPSAKILFWKLAFFSSQYMLHSSSYDIKWYKILKANAALPASTTLLGLLISCLLCLLTTHTSVTFQCKIFSLYFIFEEHYFGFTNFKGQSCFVLTILKTLVHCFKTYILGGMVYDHLCSHFSGLCP